VKVWELKSCWGKVVESDEIYSMLFSLLLHLPVTHCLDGFSQAVSVTLLVHS